MSWSHQTMWLFLKLIWEQFGVTWHCSSNLTLPGQPYFDSLREFSENFEFYSFNPFTPRPSLMMRWFVTLTFQSVYKILSCYHSNETSLAELLHRTICFLGFSKMKFGIFGDCFALATLGVKGLKWKILKFHFANFCLHFCIIWVVLVAFITFRQILMVFKGFGKSQKSKSQKSKIAATLKLWRGSHIMWCYQVELQTSKETLKHTIYPWSYIMP